MIRPRIQLPAPRRGIILLVVLFLLTLFAIVGITFVLYADATAHSARLFRESESVGVPYEEPELLLAHFLGQLLFDVYDDEAGVSSALRGHSLARNMYGLNTTYTPATGTWSTLANSNITPYNGTGRLHYPSPLANVDDYYLINYTYFRNDNFLRDPERFGSRTGLNQQADSRGPYTGGASVPYTYPDLNNLFLAAVKADGTVLIPSFHRPWLFGPNDPANPNWTNQEGKYLTLRPRPADHDPRFPFPEDAGGDVKNLIGAPGGNDSYWIDIGFPVQVGPNGRKYKPLFAPLIVDLDNRVNINVHGNIYGQNRTHVSNQGWGRWEVNPGRVLDRGNEWTNLLIGNPAFPTDPYGRYGSDLRPVTGGSAVAGRTPRFYGQVDFDARQTTTLIPSTPFLIPGVPNNLNPAYYGFPNFPATSFENGSAAERLEHPLLFNAFPTTFPAPRGTTGDYVFRASNMEALLRYGQTGTQALTSDLFRLCPQNFGDPTDPVAAAKRRRLVTTHSFDWDRPGLTPWVWDSNAAPYQLTDTAPSGGAIPFPDLVSRPPSPTPGEFAADWRARVPPLGRLDLNRSLPDYPAVNTAGNNGRITNNIPAFQAAQLSRRLMAADIFEQLRFATTGAYAANGTAAPITAAVGSPEFNALRWLAQLSVNIVDYIDTDDYITPFNWFGTNWVYGTELPRVVLNEVYAEHAVTNAARSVSVWVELHNPFSRGPVENAALPEPTWSDNGAAKLFMPAVGTEPAYGIFQIVLSRPNTNLRLPDNVLGDPGAGSPYVPPLSTWVPATGPALAAPAVPYTIAPNNVDPRFILPLLPTNRYAGASGGNRGFYVVGPGPLPGTSPTRPNPTLQRQEMSYPEDPSAPAPTVLLRRLACPHLPPDNNTASPTYNPYVTVDYVENVTVNDSQAAVQDRVSVGRNQPYAAHPSQLRKQQPMPPLTDQPQHTFFRHNALEAAATPPPNPDPAAANQTLKLPFDWLVHLDRQLISPMELLQVSAFKPHELTQQFVVPDGAGAPQPFSHRAPWFDQAARLYRVFEFLETHDRMAGMQSVSAVMNAVSFFPPAPGQNTHIAVPRLAGVTASGVPWRIQAGSRVLIGAGVNEEWVIVKSTPDATSFVADLLKPKTGTDPITLPNLVGDRIAGKINLNTIWDVETFRALCDAQPANSFAPGDVDNVFALLMGTRTPTVVNGVNVPGPNDRPFRGMAAGFTMPTGQQYDQYPAGSGIEDTLLRAHPTVPTQRLFASINPTPENNHPYLRDQLLTKIFNNVTPRSNVFAIWVTVGFFEVLDENARPPRLGAEIGRSENRQIRHRMFAIVDRTWRAATTQTSNSNVTRTSQEAVDAGPGMTVTPNGGMANIHPQTSIRIWHMEQAIDPVTGEPLFDANGNPVMVEANVETVRVLTVEPPPPGTPTSFTANFQFFHPAGSSLRFSIPPNTNPVTAPLHNNSGPVRPRFDPRNFPGVVLHYSAID